MHPRPFPSIFPGAEGQLPARHVGGQGRAPVHRSACFFCSRAWQGGHLRLEEAGRGHSRGGLRPWAVPSRSGLSVRKQTAHARSATSGEPLPQSPTRLWLAPGSGQDHGRGHAPSPLLRGPEGCVAPHSLDTQDGPS